MDHEALSRELVRRLRGKHSQPWLCRRLGLRSNLVYRWESGRAFPSAEQFFRICRVTRARGSLELDRFLGGPFDGDLESKAGIMTLLALLAGKAKVHQVAANVGRSRFVVSRWLAGSTQIRLPDLLHFVESMTHRLLDFCAVYVDPSTLESVSPDWRRLQATRAAAYEVPWSHGVLRALELTDYARVTGSSVPRTSLSTAELIALTNALSPLTLECLDGRTASAAFELLVPDRYCAENDTGLTPAVLSVTIEDLGLLPDSRSARLSINSKAQCFEPGNCLGGLCLDEVTEKEFDAGANCAAVTILAAPAIDGDGLEVSVTIQVDNAGRKLAQVVATGPMGEGEYSPHCRGWSELE